MKKKIIIIALIGLGLISIGVWNHLRNPLSFANRISDAVPKDGSEVGPYGAVIDELSEVKFVYGHISEEIVADILAHGIIIPQAFEEEEGIEIINALYEKYGVTEAQLEKFMEKATPYDDAQLAARIRQKEAAREMELRQYYQKEILAKQKAFMEMLEGIEDYDYEEE